MTRRLLIYILLLSALATAQLSLAADMAIRGQVRTTAGVPLRNVAVTDGYTTVLSDDDGRYCLTASPAASFVYITLPAGFEVSFADSHASFYLELSKGGKVGGYDFVLKEKGDDTAHAFIVVGDPQVYKQEDVHQVALLAKDIKDYRDSALSGIPVHGMATGDMVADRPDLFDAVKQALSSSDLDFFYCKGNHDLMFGQPSNRDASRSYEAAFGPRYYAFNRGLIHYVVLDNVDYAGGGHDYVGDIDEEQFRWLAQDLKLLAKGATVVLMMHMPTTSKAFRKTPASQTLRRAAQLYELMQDYELHIISGHTHLHDHFRPAPHIWEHNQASISGIFWQEATCADGTPVGYSIYRAEGNRLTWQYKVTGISDKVQCHAYGIGENPDRPNEIMALVWNYDPTWRVRWYEDGVYAGEMQQFVGHDPKTRSTIIKNKGRYAYDWIWTTETDHLFSATPLNTAAQIDIIVEDGFGNTYKIDVKHEKAQ